MNIPLIITVVALASSLHGQQNRSADPGHGIAQGVQVRESSSPGKRQTDQEQTDGQAGGRKKKPNEPSVTTSKALRTVDGERNIQRGSAGIPTAQTLTNRSRLQGAGTPPPTESGKDQRQRGVSGSRQNSARDAAVHEAKKATRGKEYSPGQGKGSPAKTPNARGSSTAGSSANKTPERAEPSPKNSKGTTSGSQQQ
jgi:hypothetical protein